MNSHVSPAVGKIPTAAAIEDYIRDNNLSPGTSSPRKRRFVNACQYHVLPSARPCERSLLLMLLRSVMVTELL